MCEESSLGGTRTALMSEWLVCRVGSVLRLVGCSWERGQAEPGLIHRSPRGLAEAALSRIDLIWRSFIGKEPWYVPRCRRRSGRCRRSRAASRIDSRRKTVPRAGGRARRARAVGVPADIATARTGGTAARSRVRSCGGCGVSGMAMSIGNHSTSSLRYRSVFHLLHMQARPVTRWRRVCSARHLWWLRDSLTHRPRGVISPTVPF